MTKENAAALNELETDDNGLLFKTVSITRAGKTRTFVIHEAPYGKIAHYGAELNPQDDAKRVQAAANYVPKLLAACVEENGEKLTVEKALALPSGIGKRLEAEVAELNGILKGAELDQKNE